jgi:hypothetical protein
MASLYVILTFCLFCWYLIEVDYQSADILINVDSKEPSWWVWVADETDPINFEECSGIDDESYLIISEEHVVDGVANFMARCIMSNPKARVYTHLIHTLKCIVINLICRI